MMDAGNDDAHPAVLARDLRALLSLNRRQALRFIAGAGLMPMLGCTSTSAKREPSDGESGSCSSVPEETAGPFPGDGSNGPNILSESGVVRRDIRSSIGALDGTAPGVPLTVTLTLLAAGGSCEPLSGHAVYIWHCDRAGDYSMYNNTEQNYLRGVQVSDENGQVTFISIFPACYPGRMPHIHFEIYPSLASTTQAGSELATSQLAFPTDVCDAVYATAGYAQSVIHLAQISFASDTVFRDGTDGQIASVSGDVTSGYAAELTVGVAT